MRIKVNSNIVSGLIFFILSMLILLFMPQQIMITEDSNINAQTIPRLVTVVMLICSVLLFIQGIFFNEKKEVNFSKKALWKEFRGVTIIAIFIVYGFLINRIGFLLSSLFLASACLVFFKVKDWRIFAVVFVIVFIIYYGFAEGLNVNLP